MGGLIDLGIKVRTEYAYSRSPANLEKPAGENGAQYGSVAEAAAGAEALLPAVHWSRVEDVLAQAGDMASQVVLNCCVPLDATDTDTDLVLGTINSGAEELAGMRPQNPLGLVLKHEPVR